MDNVRRSGLDKFIDWINIILVVVLVAIILYPLIFVLIASLSDPVKIYDNPLQLWPRGLTFASYKTLLENHDIWVGFKNTIMYTFVGVIINLVMTTLAAYPLSRKDFYGRSLFTLFFVFTMFFSGGLIPTYLVNKQLGLLDTFWVMVLPQAINVFYLIIMRTYFQTNIPRELEESAHVDGCGDFKLLYQIVLPLSTPIVAVLVLFYGVLQWNSYFNALVYLNNAEHYPIQLVIREILINNQMSDMMGITQVDDKFAERLAIKEGIKYAVVIVSSLPLLIIYPFLSKFFEKGILVGSLKG